MVRVHCAGPEAFYVCLCSCLWFSHFHSFGFYFILGFRSFLLFLFYSVSSESSILLNFYYCKSRASIVF